MSFFERFGMRVHGPNDDQVEHISKLPQPEDHMVKMPESTSALDKGGKAEKKAPGVIDFEGPSQL